MPKTQRYINVSGVTFTPTGGAAVALEGASRVVVNPRARAEAHHGDADVFPSAKRVVMRDPVVTVDALENGALDAVAVGTGGVLTFVHNDSLQGAAAGGGATRVTVSVAVYLGSVRTGPYRKHATSAVTFETYSPNGRTDPVQVSAV
jgi:hypothetical protein